MPDPNSTQNFQVAENGTRNRPGMLVESAVQVSSGFGLYRWVSGWIADDVILAGSVEIWPDHDEILPDLIEISPDLVGSDGISSNLHRRTPNTAGFCKFSSKILRVSPEVFGFMIRSSGSGFGGGNPPTDSKGVGFCGQRPTTDIGVVGSDSFQFEFGRVARVGQFSGLGGQSYASLMHKCLKRYNSYVVAKTHRICLQL